MVNVLEVPLYDQDIPSAVEEVLLHVHSSQHCNYCISATGAHGLVEASDNPMFKQVLRNFFMNLPDGMPSVWIGRLKGASGMHRCYGPDFFAALMKATAGLTVKHFFCGGKEGVADELRIKCFEKFSNRQVVDTYCPPFRSLTDKEMESLGQRITDSGAQIVWIGLSTPKQEVFAQRLARFTSTCFIITVGAAFDFHTDRLKQAPRWVQYIGLEWFFRLMVEPRRLFMRYFKIVPKFIWLNIKEFLHICIYKLRGK
jgi:N-acetylglucosaminyldiphosphoundecaprenol N-acetyl-beta-D-mannosaminyltransferase